MSTISSISSSSSSSFHSSLYSDPYHYPRGISVRPVKIMSALPSSTSFSTSNRLPRPFSSVNPNHRDALFRLRATFPIQYRANVEGLLLGPLNENEIKEADEVKASADTDEGNAQVEEDCKILEKEFNKHKFSLAATTIFRGLREIPTPISTPSRSSASLREGDLENPPLFGDVSESSGARTESSGSK